MILSIMMAISLFYIGAFIPITGFVFPMYLLKKSQEKDKKEVAILHLVVYLTLLIGSMFMGEDKILLMIFLGIYVIIELVYFFLKKNTQLGIFDKVIATSSLATLFIVIIYFMNLEMFKVFFVILEEFYKVQFKMTDQMATEYFKLFFSNSLYMVYVYVFLITILTYFFMDKKGFKDWKISYIYLIIYIIPMIITKVFKIENIYLQNIVDILRFVYIVYGVKVLYFFLKKKLKYGFLTNIIIMFMTALFPIATFVIGAIKSFELKLNLSKSY